MPNGRSRGRRRGRRPKRRSNEKGGRTVQTAAPALFAFMGSLSSSVGLSAWRWACAVPRCGSRCFRNGQRKAIIRTHRLSETGSDYIGLVRATGLEPARFWQWNLNPPSLPIPPCPLISAGCAAVCFPSGLPGYLNTNISHCQSDSFFFFRSLFCPFCPEKTACMGFYTVYLPFYP